MAAIIKLRYMPVMQRCLWNHKVNRNISTSKKDSDTATATTSVCDSVCEPPKKNWVSYGFDYKSEKEDTSAHNASFFFSVTLCLVFGSFMWAYAPDVHMRDWAQREAFLELRRREKVFDPPITPFYVDPTKIMLPEEGDLCDIEIVI